MIDYSAEPLLSVHNLVVHFPVKQGFLGRVRSYVRAVDGVDLKLWKGETLGLVGESGCGKSTTGKAILRLVQPTAGKVLFEGQDVFNLDRDAMRTMRRRMQIVFQDPVGALNPRMSVGAMLQEVLVVHGLGGANRRARAQELLDRVGLNADHIDRYPHEFSGGQRQRLGIARALAVEPELLVLDEPVSALDVSVQAQVVNLLADLQRDMGLTYLFIAHDLSLVKHVCDRIAVMYLGRVAESGTTDQVYSNPAHPYTRALLSAAPVATPRGREGRERIVLERDISSEMPSPDACPFEPRCPSALKDDVCRSVVPTVQRSEEGRSVACHHHGFRGENGG